MVGDHRKLKEQEGVADTQDSTDQHQQVVGAGEAEKVVEVVRLAVRAVREPMRQLALMEDFGVRRVEQLPEVAVVVSQRHPSKQPEVHESVRNDAEEEHRPATVDGAGSVSRKQVRIEGSDHVPQSGSQRLPARRSRQTVKM